MSTDLILKPQCGCCGATSNLYGSNCKHMTLCVSCGKTMAEKKAKCHGCGATVTRLIREYNVRASTVSDKNYFMARFGSGLPNFSKKKSSDNKWSVRKHNKELPASRDKDNNEPWLLEDETGQSQYEGRQSEGSDSATKYYLLMRQGKEFCAIPAGSSFTFNKKITAQYRQLTTEEAEEKMNSRKRTEDGYDRWMMKEPKGDKKMAGEDGDKGNLSDKEEEEEENDDEQEKERKSRLGLNKKGGDDDLDDDGSEKGDDWEHEKFFSDDDEDVISPEERQDFEPVVPAPSKMDDEDDDEEEGGGLSKTGKELKILLGRSCGLNGSDAEEEDENLALPQLVAPKHKDAPKLEEPVVDKVSPVKPVPSGSGATANPSASMCAKGKRKLNGDETNDVPPKKVKTENGNNSSVPSGPVSEEEIRAVLKQKSPITLSDLVNNFPRSRLTSKDEFAAILRKICKVVKENGIKYIVLKEN